MTEQFSAHSEDSPDNFFVRRPKIVRTGRSSQGGELHDRPAIPAERVVDPLNPTSEQIDAVLQGNPDDGRPTFIHASTGAELNMADVKGLEARAAELHDREVAIGQHASGAAEGVRRFAESPDTPAPRVRSVEMQDGSIGREETVQLDDEHSATVRHHQGGAIDSITVSASDGTGEMHEVSVYEPERFPPKAVFIDNELVTSDTDATLVAQVMEQTESELDALTPTEQSEEPAETEAAPEKKSSEEQFRDVLTPYLGITSAEQAIVTIAAEKGVNPEELKAQLASGKLNVSPEAVTTMKKLLSEQVAPNSPVWETNPRANSMLASVSRNLNQLLVQTIREALK